MSLISPQLEAFVAVVRSTTVHGAARELNITQTGVTQRIRSLEKSLSSSLFTRSRKGMRLTQEGEALFRYCQGALEMEGETLAQIHGAGQSTDIRVAVTGPTSILEARIVPQCLDVMIRHPKLALTFCVNDLEARIEDLKVGKSHLAVLPREHVAREMDSKMLRPESYMLVGAASWKGRPLREIVSQERIIDFDATDQMSFNYLRKFKLLDLAKSERHFVNNNQALIGMFARGIGYGVLTTDVAKPHLEAGRITVLNGSATYQDRNALAWYPRLQMPSYFRALIRAIH